LCKKHGIGVFILDQNCSYWDGVKMLIKRWDGMTDVMRNKQKPFWVEVKPRSLKQLPI
jgi:hypothetical protein